MQHIRGRRPRVETALHVIDMVERSIPGERAGSAEKAIVGAKLNVRSGKNVDQTICSLISRLWPVEAARPFSLQGVSKPL